MPSACGSVYVGNALLKNVCGQAITFLVLRYPFYPGSFLCFSSHSRLIQQVIKFQLSTPTPPIKIAWYTVWQPFWALWTMCGVPYTRQLNQTNSGSKYTIQTMLSNLLLKQQFTVIPASIKKLLKVWIIYSSLKSTWQLLQNIVSVTLELLSRNNQGGNLDAISVLAWPFTSLFLVLGHLFFWAAETITGLSKLGSFVQERSLPWPGWKLSSLWPLNMHWGSPKKPLSFYRPQETTYPGCSGKRRYWDISTKNWALNVSSLKDFGSIMP